VTSGSPDLQRPPIGRDVLLLGFVSLLTDVSSEMLYPVIPLFLTATLGAPMAIVGLIEGIAESSASLLKLISGRLSDRAGRRREFVTAGYALSAFAKPLLAIAGSWSMVLGARVVDRTGKGIRGPARDAIIAATTPPAARGRAFGLHRAMDTIGGVLGPLIGIVALAYFGLGYRAVFLIAFVPAIAGVALTLFVREPAVRGTPAGKPPSTPASLRLRGASISPQLRHFLLVVALFSLGNSSNAFLLLRARDVGWSEPAVLGLYVLYNAVYAATAFPAGILADRLGRRAVIFAGLAVFAVVYAGMAVATSPLVVGALLALYGVYSATTGSAMRALVADAAGDAGAATAQGLYQAVTGVMLLAASLIAGTLWTLSGPTLTFTFGTLCALAATAVFAFPPKSRQLPTGSKEPEVARR
jgi:MFS family permease